MAIQTVDTHATREAWLMAGVERITPIFAAQGHLVPSVRVSIGWPGTGQRSTTIGECWPTGRSADGVNHIFIVPSLDDAVQVLDVLTHELVHAVDDCQHGHGKEFKEIALSVGLQGPRMRSASAGDKLRARLTAIAAELGPFPHGALTRRPPRARNPDPPRARCPQCEYRLSIPKKFLHLGPPICPTHQVPMEASGDWEGWRSGRVAIARPYLIMLVLWLLLAVCNAARRKPQELACATISTPSHWYQQRILTASSVVHVLSYVTANLLASSHEP